MLSIKNTWPAAPSYNHMFMLEAMTFKVWVTASKVMVVPEDIIVQVWTNLYLPGNPDGQWYAIDLCHVETCPESIGEQDGDRVEYMFSESTILTSDGDAYRFTFRVKLSSEEDWVWAAGYMVDGIVKVSPPTGERWTKGPEFNHIIGNIYLGNFMASSIADKLGFDAVLNVADNLDLVPSNFSRSILYYKIQMQDGARNKIPDNLIAEAVQWLHQQEAAGRKTIVNCRAGIGRAGSTVVAYIFSLHPTWSFEEAYKFVFQKRFVYPHTNLRETLYVLYPRS